MQPTFSFSTRKKRELERKIQNARRGGNLHWIQRLNALYLLMSLRLYQEDAAKAAGVCVRTIQRWWELYMLGGARNLLPKKSPGRPRRLTKSQRRELYDDIAVKGPETCGYQTGVWTADLVQDHIQTRFGVFYSQYYIPQLLRNLGCSFIKAKRHYKLEDRPSSKFFGFAKNSCRLLEKPAK